MTWAKGQSGNPKGRPKRGNAMTVELQRILRMKDEDGIPNRQKIAQALFNAALEGNIKAIEDIYERMDGKVEQPQEITGKDGGPIVVTLADIARRVMAEDNTEDE